MVEKYLDGEPLKEEKSLLQKEMTGFLKYYRDVIIPGIEARITALSASLLGKDYQLVFSLSLL